LVALANTAVISQSTGAWFTRKPLPIPRQEIPHAVLNGKIYVPGGFAVGGLATNMYLFLSASDSKASADT
jgi:hypothetical protein